MQGPIGFIGLGIMGRPMARNLLKAGFSLVVHNRSQGAVAELTAAGAEAAGSPEEVARKAEVVILMLPNSPDVELVALGPRGLLGGVRAGQTVVDMSTISPIVSQKVGAALAEKGVRMLDAPVSGGEKGAIEGALSIMVGGEARVFEEVRPVLQAMGKTITHLGPLGAGGFTKLANQIIVAVNLTALAEALTLAVKAGLDIELTLKALAGGLAGSRCLDQKAPNYLAHEFKPGFKIDLHYKDLGLIMDAARTLGVPLVATAAVQELFGALRARGGGGLDHSGIITLVESLAGVEVRKRG
jgi:2-hydroxy-3-oxopropionate reductase